MKKLRIIALHLAYGGIEKAIISMANIFVERYDVEILSVYNMPDYPAFPLDERVKVRYLTDDIPNRQKWKKALSERNIPALLKESVRAVKILRNKKQGVINAIREIDDGIIITTRHEDNMVLSKYGSKNVLKIAQFHQDHRFEEKYVKGFAEKYGNIDIFAHLTPSLMEEVSEMMAANKHTKHAYVPNFLETFPELDGTEVREKSIISVGRLHPGKGFDRLVRIFSTLAEEFPDWKLKIIGDGEEKENLQHQIEELGLQDQVILTGKMNSFQLEEEMKKASVFAMTSHSEGLSFVILETQSCGLPLVVFDVRVCAKMVVNEGVNGFLVEDCDEQGFADKLRELMSSPEKCAQMGANARCWAEEFSAEKVKEIWFSVLENQL